MWGCCYICYKVFLFVKYNSLHCNCYDNKLKLCQQRNQAFCFLNILISVLKVFLLAYAIWLAFFENLPQCSSTSPFQKVISREPQHNLKEVAFIAGKSENQADNFFFIRFSLKYVGVEHWRDRWWHSRRARTPPPTRKATARSASSLRKKAIVSRIIASFMTLGLYGGTHSDAFYMLSTSASLIIQYRPLTRVCQNPWHVVGDIFTATIRAQKKNKSGKKSLSRSKSMQPST